MMKAMTLKGLGSLTDQPAPLTLAHVPVPEPAEQEMLLRVSVCGVCHINLDEIEGRPPAPLPLILGHQVVGRVSLHAQVQVFPLEAANQAQQKIKPGRIRGTKVMLVHPML